MAVWGLEEDLRLRRAAMAWLTVRSQDGRDAMSSQDLEDFVFEGRRVALLDKQRGIRKPAILPAALSIRTVYRPVGAQRPYDDSVGDDGLIRYKWRSDDADHAENRALRNAQRLAVPLIWFFGVGSALYKPVFPVFVIGENRAKQEFHMLTGDAAQERPGDSRLESELARRYRLQLVAQRVHQPVFRSLVMRAYETSCSVCALRHGELLDAAHIDPDGTDEGIAAVSNGMALCKIHHAAFDSGILGVRPDYVVEIRTDLLEEKDGPMLRYGIQERHGQPLMKLPAARRERPDRARLERHYARFRAS